MNTFAISHEQTASAIINYSRAVSDRWWLPRVARFVMPEDRPRGCQTTRWAFWGDSASDDQWFVAGLYRYNWPDGSYCPRFACRVPFGPERLGALARGVRQHWVLRQCWDAVKDEPQRRLLVEPGWRVVDVPIGLRDITLHFLVEDAILTRRRSAVHLTFREEMTVERMDDRWRLVDDYRLDLVPDRITWSGTVKGFE